jgi:hypothetical protein
MVDSATPLGSGGWYDALSAGNLPTVGLPAVTTSCGISDAINLDG